MAGRVAASADIVSLLGASSGQQLAGGELGPWVRTLSSPRGQARSRLRLEGVRPAQLLEAREATVGAEPGRVVVQRIRREVCVRDIVAARADVVCQLPEQLPLAAAWPQR